MNPLSVGFGGAKDKLSYEKFGSFTNKKQFHVWGTEWERKKRRVGIDIDKIYLSFYPLKDKEKEKSFESRFFESAYE